MAIKLRKQGGWLTKEGRNSLEVSLGRVCREAELDEQWSHVGDKSNPRWIWYAVDHFTLLSWKIKLSYWIINIWLKNQLGLGRLRAGSASPSSFSNPTAAFRLEAQKQWSSLAFISDIHLHPQDLDTFYAWRAAVQQCHANALFILGDLFEAWVGDDQLQAEGAEATFLRECVAVLRQSVLQRPTFILAGNRDFLLGQAFWDVTHCQPLPDPCVLSFAGQRFLLSHGDAWCLADKSYQRARQVLRSPELRRLFLQLPLRERIQIGRFLRQRSQAHQHKQVNYADVDLDIVRIHLLRNQANTLIHGHTHRPATQDLGQGLRRVVLSDWDAKTKPARMEVVYLNALGFTHINTFMHTQNPDSTAQDKA